MLSLLGLTVIGGMLLHQASLHSPASLAKTSVANCQEQYCPPTAYQIHVDPAVKTTLRDDRLGATTLRGVYNHMKSQYMREAAEHPGVALVAHAIN